MLKTLDWLSWLLIRNWQLTCREVKGPDGHYVAQYTFREPDGVSGDDYQATDFLMLPPAVEAYIRANAEMVPMEGRPAP